ncbi:MAG: hypothetical protein Q8Q20_05905 [bacterium]|nr:hypothetical protein [bacterium]
MSSFRYVDTPPVLGPMPTPLEKMVMDRISQCDSGCCLHDPPPEEVVQIKFQGDRDWYLWTMAQHFGLETGGRPVTNIPLPRAYEPGHSHAA